MESLQNIKKRLKSVANINQITKAMELVAATKMRKSQEIALASRPYAYASLDLLAKLSGQERKLPVLLRMRPIKTTLFVLMASDKGLAGSFNSAVFKKFEKFIVNWEKKDLEIKYAGIGEKSSAYLISRKLPVSQKFAKVGDFVSPEQTKPLSDWMVEGFLNGKWDEVMVFSANFRSALKQEVVARKIFPVSLSEIRRIIKEIVPETGKFAEHMSEHKVSFTSEKTDEYELEPSPDKLLENLASHLVRMQVYHMVLEANVSEHAARRMAMKSASDNAKDLSEKLEISYNKSRQASITKELVEITAGAEALNN